MYSTTINIIVEKSKEHNAKISTMQEEHSRIYETTEYQNVGALTTNEILNKLKDGE